MSNILLLIHTIIFLDYSVFLSLLSPKLLNTRKLLINLCDSCSKCLAKQKNTSKSPIHFVLKQRIKFCREKQKRAWLLLVKNFRITFIGSRMEMRSEAVCERINRWLGPQKWLDLATCKSQRSYFAMSFHPRWKMISSNI